MSNEITHEIIDLVSSDEEESHEIMEQEEMAKKTIKPTDNGKRKRDPNELYNANKVSKTSDTQSDISLVQITIRSPQMNDIHLGEIPRSTRIDDLKKKIFQKVQLATDLQRILLAGKELRNKSLLSKYIKTSNNNSILHLFPRTKQKNKTII